MADYPDCAIDLNNQFVFGSQNQERPPWKICCGHIERSLICVVDSFLQLSAVIFCFITITYYQFTNPQIWSLLGLPCTYTKVTIQSRFFLTVKTVNSCFQMRINKLLRTDPHFLMAVVGPSGCGKRHLVADLLVKQANLSAKL